MVVVGAVTVVARGETPMHEHAEEYLTVPEQSEAYAGTELGRTVTCLGTRAGVMVTV